VLEELEGGFCVCIRRVDEGLDAPFLLATAFPVLFATTFPILRGVG